jgi:hypothetical protein
MRVWRGTVLTLGGIAVVVLSFSITLLVLDHLDLSKSSLVSFVVEPARLRVCDPPVIATVSWNVAIPGIKRVTVFLIEKNGGETPFANRAEVVGSASTGAWVGTNTTFVLRDSDTNKQLAEFTVASEDCH